ncbi:MAG: alpha/beta fold hydrolase [Aquimonas sp.]|nr:alpha/beta fold hydrolase [Aquimonas sp.]
MRRRLRIVRWAFALGLCGLWLAGTLAPLGFLKLAITLDSLRSGVEHVQVSSDGMRWSLLRREGAAGAPTVLLLHGFTGSKENWLPLVRALPSDWNLIAPDLPGWGESERVEGVEYGYAAQADRLARLIRTLELSEVLLVGHSMGGGIAAVTAARHPEAFSRVALLSAAGTRFRDNPFGLAVLRGEHPFAVQDRESLNRYLGLVFERPPWLVWPLPQALVERRIRDYEFELQVLNALRGESAFLPGDLAAGIRQPTLLLWCRDDPVVDASSADLYADRIDKNRIVLLDDCAHMPMMERAADTADALRLLWESPP